MCVHNIYKCYGAGNKFRRSLIPAHAFLVLSRVSRDERRENLILVVIAIMAGSYCYECYGETFCRFFPS